MNFKDTDIVVIENTCTYVEFQKEYKNKGWSIANEDLFLEPVEEVSTSSGISIDEYGESR